MTDQECAVCEHGFDEYRRNMSEKIEKYGHAVVGVTGGPEGGFSYSIGLTNQKMPELIMIGHDPEISCIFINNVVDFWKEHGVQFGVFPTQFTNKYKGVEMPLKLQRVDPTAAEEEYTCQVREFVKQDYSLVQIIMCDMTGKLPGEPGFNAADTGMQIVLPALN